MISLIEFSKITLKAMLSSKLNLLITINTVAVRFKACVFPEVYLSSKIILVEIKSIFIKF